MGGVAGGSGMMKWLLLVLLLVIVLLPPAIHNYTYPSVGDDAAAHLENMDRIRNGEEPVMSYWGTAIVEYPLVWIAEVLGASNDTAYVWWSYGMMALAGIVLYLVVSSLANRWAGVTAAGLTLFGTQGAMYLFNYGVMFDIVNMMVILPVAIWLGVRWLSRGGWWYGIGAVMVFCLFSVFHTSGEYLRYVVLVLLVGYLVLMVAISVKDMMPKQLTMIAHTPITVMAFLITVALLSWLLTSDFTSTPDTADRLQASGPWLATLAVEGINVPTFLFGVLGLVPIGLGILGAAVIVKRKYEMRAEEWLLVVVLVALSGVLVGGAFINGVSPDPSRQALDLAIVVTVLIAVIVGVAVEAENSHRNRVADSAGAGDGDVVRIPLGVEQGG